MTPMKNVELTDRSSERQADDIDLIGPSVYGDSIYRELGHICFLNIFLMYTFEYARPYQTKPT